MKEGDVGDNDLTARLVERAAEAIRSCLIANQLDGGAAGRVTMDADRWVDPDIMRYAAEDALKSSGLLSRLQAAEKVVEAAEKLSATIHDHLRDEHPPCLVCGKVCRGLDEALAAWKEQG